MKCATQCGVIPHVSEKLNFLWDGAFNLAHTLRRPHTQAPPNERTQGCGVECSRRVLGMNIAIYPLFSLNWGFISVAVIHGIDNYADDYLGQMNRLIEYGLGFTGPVAMIFLGFYLLTPFYIRSSAFPTFPYFFPCFPTSVLLNL